MYIVCIYTYMYAHLLFGRVCPRARKAGASGRAIADNSVLYLQREYILCMNGCVSVNIYIHAHLLFDRARKAGASGREARRRPRAQY